MKKKIKGDNKRFTTLILLNMKNRFKLYLYLSMLYALFIFYLSSKSSFGDPMAIFNLLNFESLKNAIQLIEQSNLKYLLYPIYFFYLYPDKVEHIFLYAGFGYLLYYTLRNSTNNTFKNYAFLFAVIIGAIYGASDEFHQSFVPGRTESFLDLLADIIGVALAQVLIFSAQKLFGPQGPLARSKKKTKNQDLKAAVILIFLSIVFILIPPYNQTFLRILLALPLLLFLPGYLFMAVMFPKKGELSAIERFTLSIGLSIAITVFDGFGLNYTPWGFRPNSIVFSLTIIMGVFLFIAYLLRWRFKEVSYEFCYDDIVSFYRTIRSKEAETGPEYDPALEKMLIKTMIIAILIVSAMFIYAKVTQVPEKFTALYILGENGKAENYPAEVSVGVPSTILVGVENYEYEKVNYTLAVTLGGKTIKEQEIMLDHNEKWLDNVTFIPELTKSIAFAGANRSKLEFQLQKSGSLYRSVHLLVNTSLDSVDFGGIPELSNGNMESDSAWDFTSSDLNITGSYNNTTNSSSRAFQINYSAENESAFGQISQNLTTNGTARAIIAFDAKDSEMNFSYYAVKQALLDGNVIWESPVGGKNNSWEHAEIQVLLSGNNTLAFRVYGRYRSPFNATVWFDNVQLKSYVPKQYAPITRNETRYIPFRNVSELNFDIRGEPIPLANTMKIDGFGFSGFRYNFSGNTSFEELYLNLSENRIVEAGNATYITRANGTELYLMGSSYRILGKDIPLQISPLLTAHENKNMMLGETWNFGGGYSLSIKLISSKSDSVMLELKKGTNVVDSKLVNTGGIYEYRAKAGKYQVTVIRAKVSSIFGENVELTEIDIYSDEVTVLNLSTAFGDFAVTNISANEIVFNNTYPFELKDMPVILKGSLGLKLVGDRVYPYAKGVEMRGTPQYIYYGNWMNITGFNFPGFYLDNDISYEELRMYFTGNGIVDTGKAVYMTRVHSGSITFMGNTYELSNVNRPGFISNILEDKNVVLEENKTREVEGYEISYKNIDNQSIKLTIKKAKTKEQKKLLNITINSNVTFFPDVYFEMFAGSSRNLYKSNTLSPGDVFEYWIEYQEDRKYKAVSGEFIGFNNSSIEMKIRVYEKPFEIIPGKTYGEFEVENINLDMITLKNNKPLRFMQGKETSIMNGVIKIRVFPKEYMAYPVK